MYSVLSILFSKSPVVSGNFFIGNGSQLTGITVAAGSTIVNGNSNVTVVANSNINMFVPKLITPKMIKISAGKELAQFIPLSDKRVDIKMHVVSDNEMNTQFSPLRFTDINWYYKHKKLLQNLEK